MVAVTTAFNLSQPIAEMGVDLDQMAAEHPRLLIVEDDLDTTYLLKHILRVGGYNVMSASSGKEALRKVVEEKPHLVLLDLMMPEMDGWETLQHIRIMSDVPVIIISALGSKVDVVKGLQEGVDDYITKPFYNAEVVARVKAVLRRSGSQAEITRLVFPEVQLIIDMVNQEVKFREKNIDLTPKEFAVLATLAKAAPAVVTYQAIAAQVWGIDTEETYRRIKYLIYLIRQKFADIYPDSDLLVNVDRLGYKLRTE